MPESGGTRRLRSQHTSEEKKEDEKKKKTVYAEYGWIRERQAPLDTETMPQRRVRVKKKKVNTEQIAFMGYKHEKKKCVQIYE